MSPRVHVPVAQRRVQLVDAAMEVMRRHGAWSLTTRAVAAEAGVPLGAVHYAFGSKTDLVRAVLESDRERIGTLLQHSVATGGTPHAQLERALLAYVEAVVADPGAEIVLQELSLLGARDPELQEAARASGLGYRADAVALLERVSQGSEATWDTDLEVLAESVLGVLFGLSLSWVCTGETDLFRRCARDQAAVLAARLR